MLFSKTRSLFALPIVLFAVHVAAHAQTPSRAGEVTQAERTTSQRETEKEPSADRVLAARAIVALKRLEIDVIVYRSLGDFEESSRLARVSFQVFQNDLQEVTAQVEPLLSRLPQSRLKTEIRNALDSYRDGAFWWQKIDQPRVVNVSALTNISRTPSDTAFLSTVPYTVAIHWRQAEKYLKRAEELVKSPTRN